MVAEPETETSELGKNDPLRVNLTPSTNDQVKSARIVVSSFVERKPEKYQ